VKMPNRDSVSLLFVPGKNWKLSLAELITFLEVNCSSFEVNLFSKTFFVVSIDSTSTVDVASLGGIIKIGEVKTSFATQTVKEAFLQKEKTAKVCLKDKISETGLIEQMFENSIYGKAIFGVSVYWIDSVFRPVAHTMQHFVGSTIKKALASMDKRASFMGFARDRDYPQLSHVEVLKKKMVENKAEVLFCVGKEQTFVATTIAVHNPFEFQKRDVGKPIQRKIFAISPRLARIMTNLAALRQGQVLLDPFCGVGTILQEALLAGAEVVGMDINNWCVEAATRNLNWLKNEYSLEDAKYRVVQGDVLKLTEKIGREQVDCIVTEPDLGPALRQIPTKPYALRLIEKLKPLHYSFLEEAFRVLRKDGRLVTVSPYIKTRSEQPVAMQISNKAAEIGYRTASIFREEFFTEKENLPQNLIGITSLIDTDERHKIGREVHVFQK